MPEQQDNFGSFFRENTKLAKDYIETRLEIYRLKGIRLVSKSAGFLIWIIVSLFLAFLLIIFLGIVASLWFSQLTGSYLAGFAITSGILLLLVIILALMRKTLFVNPIIRKFIRQAGEEHAKEKN